MATKKKKPATKKTTRKKTKKMPAKNQAKKSNGQSVRTTKLGLSKMDKANITRFCRDIVHEYESEYEHINVHKVRRAVMEDKFLRDAILEHGSLAWTQTDFAKSVKKMVKELPISNGRGRVSLTPEERAAREKNRKADILTSLKSGKIEGYARDVLITRFMQDVRGRKERQAFRQELEANIK